MGAAWGRVRTCAGTGLGHGAVAISSIGSPPIPSSLWESISRCSTIVTPTDAVVYSRLLVAFLAEPDGDEQVSIIDHEDLYNVKPAEHAVL